MRIRYLGALVIVAITLVAVPARADDFVNGSFETRDYSGWTLFEGGDSDPDPEAGTWGIAKNGQTIDPEELVYDFFDGIYVPQTVPSSSGFLPHTYTTVDGSTYVALQLQNGPEMHRMYQDVALPLGVATISWDMEYENFFGGFVPGQILAITVRKPKDDPAEDAILATLFTTQGGPQAIPTMTHFSGDVSLFAGRTVRISVDLVAQDGPFPAAFDNFKVNAVTTSVAIDIRPGSAVNPIKLENGGAIPVAILSTATFDATAVDPLSVTFGPGAATETHGTGHIVDVNGDGLPDLLLHFATTASGLAAGDTEACVDGTTFADVPIHGCDAVTIVK